MRNSKLNPQLNSASFVFDEAQQDNYNRGEEVCRKIPTPAKDKGVMGQPEYYKFRFDDFMKRHGGSCKHMPPNYYYGDLKEVDPMYTHPQKSFLQKNKIPLTVSSGALIVPSIGGSILISTLLATTTKQILLDLDSEIEKEQALVKTYTKNGKFYMPILDTSYGYKYCVAFLRLVRPHLSPNGQKWIDDALMNLQVYLEKGLIDLDFTTKKFPDFMRKYNLKDKRDRILFYKKVELDSETLREFAFATHIDAYVNAGIARLYPWELMLVMITPDAKEWGDLMTWQQAGPVAKEVVVEYGKTVYQIGSDVIDTTQALINKIFERIKNF